MMKLAIAAAVSLFCLAAQALDFSLRYLEDSSVYGPFHLEEGSPVELDGKVFKVADVDKYGKQSFLLAGEDGVNIGPFQAKEGARVKLGKAMFSVLLVAAGDKRGLPEPVKAKTGKLDEQKGGSNKLVRFEQELDSVEMDLTNALRSGTRVVGATGYESLLANFKAHSSELQEEITTRTPLGKEVGLTKDVLILAEAYEDSRTQYKGYEACVPGIISTRRNGRLPAGQPTFKQGSAEEGFIKQNYSDCRLLFDVDAYYVNSYRNFLKTRKIKGSGENLKNSLGDFVQAVARLRQQIRTLEQSGYWNTSARNGQTFYLRNISDSFK